MEDQEKITIKTTTLKTTRSIRHDHLFKVVVLGDAKVGKTSLVAAFTGSNKFSEEYLPTLAVDFKTKVLSHNEKNIKLQIWDSASTSRTKLAQMGELYYSGAMAGIYCFDITDKSTFQHVDQWMLKLSNSQYNIDKDNVIQVVVGCKSDLSADRKVSPEMGQELAIRHQARYVEVSAMTATGIDDLFQSLTKAMYTRHLETRNNAMTETRTQTLNRSLSTQSTEKPVMTRSKSLRSSFRLKSKKKKSRKSSLDVANSNNQEIQEMVPKKKQVVFEEKSKLDAIEEVPDTTEQQEGKEKQKGSTCKACCVIS